MLTDTAVTGEDQLLLLMNWSRYSRSNKNLHKLWNCEVDGKSSIKLKENNTANDGDRNICSKWKWRSNAGTIDVGGSQSIGILGMAYRETLNEAGIAVVVGAEYGDDTIG